MKKFLNRVKYPLFWLMVTVCIILVIKGNLMTPSKWNLWTVPAMVMFVVSVLFAAAYDVEVNVFKIRINKSKPENQEQELLSETDSDEAYEFEYVLSDNEIISRLSQYINEQPRRINDRQNVNLGFGICDKEGTIFVTLIYYLSDFIKRCDDGIDDFIYAVVTQDEIFTACCKSRFGAPIIKLNLDNHKEYESIVRAAINFEHNISHLKWAQELRNDNPDFNLLRYNEELKERYLRKD